MKAPIFILLYFLIFQINFVNLTESYDIGNFINYLQSTGHYNFLSTVKDCFGKDAAISACIELEQSRFCETVVRAYMLISPHSICEGERRIEDILNIYSDIISDELKEKIKIRINTFIIEEPDIIN